MKIKIIAAVFMVISFSCKSPSTEKNTYTNERKDTLPVHMNKMTPADTASPIPEVKEDWSSLKKYIGTYPTTNDFFNNRIIVPALRKILGKEYKAYKEHVSVSGSGPTNTASGLIITDVSQLHVGGYSSILFIDTVTRHIYLFWMNGTVREMKYKIYSDGPVPEGVLNLIADNLNSGWGHVAKFSISDDSLVIKPNK